MANLKLVRGRRRSRGRSQFSRMLIGAAVSPRGRIGLALMVPVILIGAGGELVAPKSPLELVGAPLEGPSASAPLGTDQLGRDVLSRVLAGGHTLLLLAILAMLLGMLVGVCLGVAAGYVRGVVDDVIMRLLDVGLAFPQLLLALLLLSILGPKPWLICLSVAAIHAPQVARVARAATLRAAEQDFVRFTEAIGIPRWRVMLGEIVPNIISPLMVEAGLRLTYSIGIIASLGFLGFGLQPPTADWGLMINENRIGIGQNPWPVLVPVALIALLTIGANMFTDAIARSALGIEAPLTEVEGQSMASSAPRPSDGEVDHLAVPVAMGPSP